MFSTARPLDFIALVITNRLEYMSLIQPALGKLRHPWHAHCLTTTQQVMDFISDGQEHQVDLLIVELSLHVMGGSALMRNLRQRWPNAPILVLTTSRCIDSDLLDAIEVGAKGFVDLDDQSTNLSQVIGSLLRGECPISPSLSKNLFRLVSTEKGVIANRNDKQAISKLLSPREHELLRHLNDGATYIQASKHMGVSLNTVQTFSRRIFQKLEVRTKQQALKVAQSNGLI